MAKLNEITINIGVTVPIETVQRCVQILNMYLTDNPNLTVKVYEDDYCDHINRIIVFEPKENDDAEHRADT